MYTVRHLPTRPGTDARGLSLEEAFARLMGLSERHCWFVRTGWQMHLVMTNPPPGAPEFVSWASSNAVARQEIRERVCRHGLGQFEVLTDTEYESALATEVQAARAPRLPDGDASVPAQIPAVQPSTLG